MLYSRLSRHVAPLLGVLPLVCFEGFAHYTPVTSSCERAAHERIDCTLSLSTLALHVSGSQPTVYCSSSAHDQTHHYQHVNYVHTRETNLTCSTAVVL